jgi:hypothetical protein
MNTHSKNFKDHEIKGVSYDENGKKVIYLKEGVRRKKFKDDVWDEEILESHLNQELINYNKWEQFYSKVLGLDDYEND